MQRIRKTLGLIILISLCVLVGRNIHHGKDVYGKSIWGYTYPVFSQQKYDLSCPSGTQPFSPLVTNNPQTGNLKANGCIDPTGLVLFNGGSAITTVTSNPATCSVGQTFFNTTTGQFLLCISTNTLTTASGSPGTALDVAQFVGIPDGQWIYSANVSVTSGSPNVTLLGANLCNGTTVPCSLGQTSTVGKKIFVNRNGTNQGPNTVDSTALAVTTVLSVTDSTHLVANINATNSCLATALCVAFFGTDYTTQLAAADAAYQASVTCKYILFPAGFIYNSNPVFNTASIACGYLPQAIGSGGPIIPTMSIQGGGASESVIVLPPTFNFAACPANGCLFSPTAAVGATLYARHLGINGGWSTCPAGGHSSILVNAGIGSVIDDVVFSGFCLADGTTIGLKLQGGSYMTHSLILGFGFVSCSFGSGFAGSPVDVEDSYCGNSAGASVSYTGGTLNTTNLIMGQTNGTAATVNMNTSGAGPLWNSKNDYIFANGIVGQTLIFAGATGASTLYFDNLTADNSSSNNTNGLFLNSATITAYIRNSTLGGLGTGFAANGVASSKIIDSGGNTFNGTGINKTAIYFKPSPEGNCTSSASPSVCGNNGTGSVAVAAASTTLTVNTTAITAQSQIILTEDSSLGTKLGVTCNTTPTVQPLTVTTRTSGTSFVFSNTAPAANPRCVSYQIIN